MAWNPPAVQMESQRAVLEGANEAVSLYKETALAESSPETSRRGKRMTDWTKRYERFGGLVSRIGD